MVTSALIVAALVGGLTAPGAAAAPNATASWPQYQGNAAHTGYNTTETTIGPGNVAGLHLLWSGSTGGNAAGVSEPAVAGGRAFLGTYEDFTLRAWNATTGAADWSAQESYGFESTPAVSGGRAFIKDDNGLLYAVSTATGTLLWSRQIAPDVGSPTLAGGVLYVAGDYTVDALSPATGAVLWSTFLTGDPIGGVPAVAGGRVFVTDGQGRQSLVALDAATGAVLWHRSAGVIQVGSPVVSGADVYTCSNTRLTAFVAATGHQLWNEPSGCDWNSTPAVAHGVIYTDPFENGQNGLFAFSASTGALLWSAGTGSDAAPVIANGVVYASTRAGTITAYDVATHALLWTSPADGLTSLALVNGILYGGGADGLCAFGL